MTSPASINILIADDFATIREGLTHAFEREPDLHVCAKASNGAEAVEMFRLHRPDITVMDLRMPLMDGVAAIEAIRTEFPKACILVLTVSEEKAAIFRALQAGATDYILKTAPRAEIIAKIRALYAQHRPYFYR